LDGTACPQVAYPSLYNPQQTETTVTDAEADVLREEVFRLKRAHQTHRLISAIACAAAIGSTLMFLNRPSAVSASTTSKDGILHVRGVVVEDASGQERVRLGAPLPDPLFHGVRGHRSGEISGLLITDATGTERGGYVTADKSNEAFLSLDSQGEQQALFLANPDGGMNFDLYDKLGNQAAITVFPDGPKFKMKKNHVKILELPNTTEAPLQLPK
jgi:hypothetical protein